MDTHQTDDFDLPFALRVVRIAAEYTAGRALDGVEVDAANVWLSMYESLKPLSPDEREVRIAQTERVMHAPTAH